MGQNKTKKPNCVCLKGRKMVITIAKKSYLAEAKNAF